MGEVKIFRVTGEIRRPMLQTSFRQMIAAVKPEHAVEKVYAELGSRHRVKRFHIEILNVEEVPPEEIEESSLIGSVAGEEGDGAES